MLHVFAEVHAAALAVSVHVCNVAALSFSTNAERNNQHHRVRKRGWKKNEKNNDTHSLVSAKNSGKRWRGTNAGMKRKKREEKEKEKKTRKKRAKNSALTAGSHYTDTLPVACSVSSIGLQTFQGLVRVTSRSGSSYVTVLFEPRHGLARVTSRFGSIYVTVWPESRHGLARFTSQSGSIYVTVWL